MYILIMVFMLDSGNASGNIFPKVFTNYDECMNAAETIYKTKPPNVLGNVGCIEAVKDQEV